MYLLPMPFLFGGTSSLPAYKVLPWACAYAICSFELTRVGRLYPIPPLPSLVRTPYTLPYYNNLI